MYKTNKKRKLHWLDAVLLLAVIGGVAFFAYRVDTVLNYDWNWSEITPYVLYYDDERSSWVPNLLLLGLFTTLRLAVWGIVIAAIIGVVMGLCRTSSNLFLRMVARTYVELIRNIPPLVFIFIFYFFLSEQIMPFLGVEEFVREASPTTLAVLSVLFGEPALLGNFFSGLLCLSLFEGAYITEIVRAGVQSVPKGQWEAGDSVGLSRGSVLRFIVVPQAVRNILPPLANQFITLIKDSSIVSLISIQELTFMAVEAAVSTTRVFEFYIALAVMYFFICYGCALLFARLERRLPLDSRR